MIARKGIKVNWVKLSLVAIFSTFLLFYAPSVIRVRFNEDWLSQFLNQDDSFLVPVLRSFCFAAGASLLIIGVSFFCSIHLQRITLKQPLSSLLGLLLVPVIIGNLSTAFIWKLLLLNNTLQGYFSKFLVIALIQLWQFGSLFIYLLWLNQQNIPASTDSYMSTIHLTAFERIRDVVLPRQKNLLLLIYLISFIFCFYENAKIELIFKASRGTHTELINQWLNRSYQSNSLINPDFAFSQIVQSGLTVLVLGIFGLTAVLFLLLWCYSRILKIRSRNEQKNAALYSSKKGNVFVIGVSTLTLLPLLLVYCRQSGQYSHSLSELSYPLILTLIAAFAATFVSITFAIAARLVWPELLGSFKQSSLFFILGLISIQLIPELLALICGFKWMQLIGYTSANTVTVAWICAHVILSFPILSSFAVVTHFSVSNRQLDYLNSHRLSMIEKVKDLFLRPLVVEYLLVFIISFSGIWNESVINNLLSDSIPSFATELNNAISGKGADYSTGMLYLSVSLVLAFLSFILWNQIIRQYRKKLAILS